MANDYVGRYGEALRRLSGLNRGGLSQPPTPSAGAFGAVSPQGPAPQTSAFSAAAPSAPAPQARTEQPPLTAAQLWRDMPDEFKGQIEKQISESGMNVDQTFASKVEEGEIEPPKKEPTLQEKLGYLAEVALRTMSNLSRPGTQGISDFADAKLATDARRGAIETAETDRRRKQFETRRVEGRQDASEQRRLASDLTERELTREGIAAEGAANRKNALDIAASQERGRQQDRRDTPGPVLIEADGTAYERGPAGTLTPYTKEEVEHVPGRRGKPGYDRKVRKPVKAKSERAFNALDEDTRQKAITAEKERLSKTREFRNTKDADLEKIAVDNVNSRVSGTIPKSRNFFDEDE